MKSIKKFIFIMVALATALAFVSCSNGDDGGSSGGSNNSSSNNSSGNNNNNSSDNNNNANDNNNNSNSSGNNVTRPSVVATYEADEDDNMLIFYSDETWEMTVEFMGKGTAFYVGTTDWGNPAKNGSISLTIKKMLDSASGKLRDVPLSDQELYNIQITNGKLNLFGEDFTRQ